MIDEARGCDPTANDGKGDCGSRLALPYFISYTIVASFVFLNLVVAFGKIVRKKRELWAEHPERHPSGAPTARTRPSSSVRVEAFSMISHLRES